MRGRALLWGFVAAGCLAFLASSSPGESGSGQTPYAAKEQPREAEAGEPEPPQAAAPGPELSDWATGLVSKQQLDAAHEAGLPAAKELDLGGGVTMRLVLIPAGSFTMGSPANEFARSDSEGPQHRVTITKPFYMGVTEVTQGQYEAAMGANPSEFKGVQNPVEHVSWYDAAEFCRKLTAKAGMTVLLPTEAEWEYACRAGTTTPFSFGNDTGRVADAYAWYTYGRSQPGNQTHRVGAKRPSPWGLCDMHGNVKEWCQDWYARSYESSSATDPIGPRRGSRRVTRGGSWYDHSWYCRSAARDYVRPGLRDLSTVGFRVAAAPGPSLVPPARLLEERPETDTTMWVIGVSSFLGFFGVFTYICIRIRKELRKLLSRRTALRVVPAVLVAYVSILWTMGKGDVILSLGLLAFFAVPPALGYLVFTYVRVGLAQISNARRKALSVVADELGLKLKATDTGLLKRLDGFRLFGDVPAKAVNVMGGTARGIEVAIFDYELWMVDRSSRGAKAPPMPAGRRTLIALWSPTLNLPDFELRPQHLTDSIADVFGHQDINFDCSPGFSRHYLLRGSDEAAIRAAFDTQVLSWYEGHPGVRTEGRGNCLIVYGHGRELKPDQWRGLMEQGFEVFALFGRS